MGSRERIKALLNNKSADRVGFWLGHPANDTKALYVKTLGIGLKSPNMSDESHEAVLLATDTDFLDLDGSRRWDGGGLTIGLQGPEFSRRFEDI